MLTGSIADRNDLDWYAFDVVLEEATHTITPFYASFTIDVDYTDGLGRPNTTLFLFNNQGQLIYSSADSSIANDQFAPTGPSALADLTTGSGGGRDPFLGTIQLQEGSYFLAVVPPTYALDVLSDPALRAEPLNSLVRIAEDRGGFTGGSNIAVDPIVPLLFTQDYSLVAADGQKIADGETFTISNDAGESVTYEFDNDGIVRGLNVAIAYDDTPVESLLYTLFGKFDPDYVPGDSATEVASTMISAINLNGPTGVTASFGSSLGSVSLNGAVGVASRAAPGVSEPSLYISKPSYVPFNLSDVTMFATLHTGRDISQLVAIDPYTGGFENIVGTFNANVEDIAIRPDGRIYGFTVPDANPDLGTIGNYHWIDPQNLATQNLSQSLGDDGIQTFQEDPANPGSVLDTQDGVLFQGIAFGQIGNTLRGFAIGNRGLPDPIFGVQGPTRNLLYEFNIDTGQAFSLTPPVPADREDLARLNGGGTQIVERGQLDTTVDPIGLGNTALSAVEATEINANGVTIPRIIDGMQFTVDDGSGATTLFEFNSGPEVTFRYVPAGGIFVRDGDTFLLDGNAYEFDTGSVIVVDALNGNALVDGQTLTITDNQIPSVTRTFEFDDGTGGPLAAGRVAIPFNSGFDQAQIITSIINSINSVGNFNIDASLLPNSNRISLRGESSITGASTTATAISISGLPGGSASLISVEENSTPTDFGQAIANAVPGAGVDGNRINFSTAVRGSFPALIARGVFQVNAAADGTVSSPTAVAVPFLASDSAAQLAQRMTTVVDAQPNLTAQLNGGSVILQNGAFFASADDPLRIGGTAPGGNFTGLAIIGQTIYGVTGPDEFGEGGGGLYRLLNPLSNGVVADYVETSTDLLTGARDQFGNPTGGPIEFTSLTPGPDNLEEGRYANTLFGMDFWGNMYAFDLQGHLLPVFMDSQVSVPTGLVGATGFTFSTLDINLWHVTTLRRDDPGHGVELAPDGSRRAEATSGNTSLYFGFEEPGNTPGNWGGVNDPVIRNNYDFPGGAQASITTNTFSLKDYDISDSPALYFSYFLDTENAVGDAAPPPFMRDSFRVFISSDDGEWQLVATNNSFRGGAVGDDEFDYGPIGVQELFDGAGWQQARIDLSNYAGYDNVRLRFDFNSAGSLDMGNPLTGGEEIRAVDGDLIFDGDTFTVLDSTGFGFGSTTFEFETGYALTTVAGSGLSDGETLTLTDGVNAPVTLEFDLGNGVSDGNVPILFHNAQSAADVARALDDAILFAFGRGVETLSLKREQNDTIPEPARASYTQGFIVSNGSIGDNSVLFGNDAGRDVDMVQLQLTSGQALTVDLTQDMSNLNPLFGGQIRLFNADGDVVASSGTGSLSLNVTNDGTYFVGISGAGNTTYDPFVQGSGARGLTGDYRLQIQIDGVDSPVITHLNGARLTIENLDSLSRSANSNLVLSGTPGTVGEPVYVHPNMSDDDVAMALRTAFASAYGSGDPYGIPGYQDVVRLYGHQIIDPGPLGYTKTGFPLGTALPGEDPDLDFNGLDGDLFGAFSASTLGNGATNANNPGYLRGRDNAFEGVYIDDIVIGFAERGTMYTSAPANDTFNRIPDADVPLTEAVIGDYQIEFRSSSFYGVADGNPIPTLFLTEAYDPTDRLSANVTLVAPRGADATDGMTFTVGDGTGEVVFEYDDPALRNGVQPGHVAIEVSPLFTSAQVANQIRDAINSAAVQAVVDLRAESRETSDRIDLFGNPVIDTGVNSTTVQLAESNDRLADAIETQIGVTGVKRFAGRGTIGDNPVIGPGLDVDMLKVVLVAGDRLTVDVDSIDLPVDTVLRLFDASGTELVLSDDAPAPGEDATRDPYLAFTAVSGGTYYIGISGFSNMEYDPTSVGSGIAGNQGDYRIDIVVGDPHEAVQVLTNDDRFGDSNVERPQGQLVISSTEIMNSSNFGVNIDAGTRQGPGNFAHQGPPQLLYEENTARLAPGVTVKNNVIAYNRVGAILYSGDDRPAGQPDSSVPFGRIVNNTLVGGRPSALPELLENLPLGVGIQAEQNVSPTILNNIIANFSIGISVDATSQSTVIGGNVYQTNTANSNAGLGDFPIVLSATDPLFVNRDAGNFNLAANSKAIDSSIDSLRDRPALVFVSQPLGIGVSPILAPELDVTGQLRVDDPTVDSPAGFGSNVFKDRGAIDRADFVGPAAVLLNPGDNDAAGTDQNPAVGIVQTTNSVVRSFDIQLNDGVTETGQQAGTGIDSATVDRDVVQVFRDGNLLQEGVDYIFSYDAASRVIRLTSLSGVWKPGRVYQIKLDNSTAGIRDLASNQLEGNQTNGETLFTISIGGEDQDFGDAPAPYPTLLLDNGASHVIDSGFYLGSSVDSESNGQPTVGADGDGGDENGVVFVDPLVSNSTVRVRVTSSQVGKIDAWMDWNRDGDWSDPGEQILVSQAVTAGANTFNVAVPASTSNGATYARFRLSRDGGLSPTGLALNGEVEDYRVTIVDRLPWHNSTVAYDVNNDGFIVALDALLVINELNNRKASDPVTGVLVNPPVAPNLPESLGFVDVDGDGYASPRDALLVINYLNNPPEGERVSLAATPVDAALAAADSADGLEAQDVAAALDDLAADVAWSMFGDEDGQ
ncbi:MAG: pre-peptidase C-terminal domain-containing protein [Planctomycetales bacterium]|nr:pre-peptidase C-terminal domain-containing protein [Planctomycetales bacterium]